MTLRRSCPAVLALVFAGFGARAAGGGESAVVLPLTVNGEEKGDVSVWMSGSDILVVKGELERLGIAETDADARGRVSLRSLAPRVTYVFEEEAVRLDLTVTAFRAGATSLVDLRRAGRPDGIVYTRDPSGFLNYSATWGASGVGAFAEAGFSFGKGLLTTTASRTADGRLTRGLSQLVLDDRERLVRTTVGDSFAGTGALGGGAFLGGVSVSRSFDLDPYFVRTPAVGISGAALTPSKLDVYVNGSLVRQLDVPPGQFDLRNLPVTAGGGDARLVLRDAFGQEREISSSYYISARTLAPGLSEFQYALGFKRSASDATYSGGLAFLGSHRLGLTENLTGGLRLEATRDLLSGGATLTGSLPVGEVEVSAAGSRAAGQTGWAASAAWSYQRHPFGAGALLLLRSDRYTTLALDSVHDRPTEEANVFASWNGIRGLGLGVSAGRLRYRDASSAARYGVTATIRLNRSVDTYASAGRNAGKDTFYVGVTYSFGAGASAGLSYQERDGFSGLAADVQQALPRGDGYGYRVHADSKDVLARAQLQVPWGRYEVNAANGRPDLTVTGGLAAVGGSFAFTRTLEQGFALVRVPGTPGVRATASNQVVGKTDAKGELLVPDLLPYYGNLLGIEDTDLPLDYDVRETRRLVAPPYRGGALVTFEARRARSVFGTVVLEDGRTKLVPAHGTVRVGGAESPVGAHGEFFFEDLEPGEHAAEVFFHGRSCRFTFTVRDGAEQQAGILKLGEISCRVPLLEDVPGDAPRARLAAPPMPAPSAAPSPEQYAVHVGSFRSRATADRESERLAAALTRPGLVRAVDLGEKGVWYRVFIGRFPSRREADDFRKGLLESRLVQTVGEVARLEAAS